MQSAISQSLLGAGCDLSRRCTQRSRPADGQSVTETTMRTVGVVMLEPGREMLIAFLRVEVMANVGPLAQGGLDKAFGLGGWPILSEQSYSRGWELAQSFGKKLRRGCPTLVAFVCDRVGNPTSRPPLPLPESPRCPIPTPAREPTRAT